MDTSTRPYEGLDNVFVAGEWREGRTGKSREDKNPYTGETLVEIPFADADDLDESYRAAQKALREWADAPAGAARRHREDLRHPGVYPL